MLCKKFFKYIFESVKLRTYSKMQLTAGFLKLQLLAVLLRAFVVSFFLPVSLLDCLPCQSVSLTTCQSVSFSACQTVSLSACQSVSLSACQSVSLSACQSVCLSACQLVSLSVCQSVSLSACQSVSLSACQSVCLVSMSACQYVSLSVCQPGSLSARQTVSCQSDCLSMTDRPSTRVCIGLSFCLWDCHSVSQSIYCSVSYHASSLSVCQPNSRPMLLLPSRSLEGPKNLHNVETCNVCPPGRLYGWIFCGHYSRLLWLGFHRVLFRQKSNRFPSLY
jgi:hypothetical protein